MYARLILETLARNSRITCGLNERTVRVSEIRRSDELVEIAGDSRRRIKRRERALFIQRSEEILLER